MGRWEIRIAGFGGQGVVSAGHALAQAVSLWTPGRDAVLSRAYGPEKQGGWARADVVISEGEVDYPLVQSPDVLVALSQDGYDRCIASLRPGGTAIVDTDLVSPGDRTDVQVLTVPATRAAEDLGRRVVANNVMLGAFTVLVRGVVAPDTLRRAVIAAAPKGSGELNARAFECGVELAHGLRRWQP